MTGDGITYWSDCFVGVNGGEHKKKKKGKALSYGDRATA